MKQFFKEILPILVLGVWALIVLFVIDSRSAKPNGDLHLKRVTPGVIPDFHWVDDRGHCYISSNPSGYALEEEICK